MQAELTIRTGTIASASSASWYHSGTTKLSCKQCLCIYKDPCLASACWAQPKPVVLSRADAGFAFLQNALSALRRSAQPSRKRDVHRGLGLHPNKQNTHGKVAMPCVFWPLYAQRHCLREKTSHEGQMKTVLFDLKLQGHESYSA